MAVDVLTEITIARPLGEVAAYAADPDNAPEWYENIESVTWRTEPPLQFGSEMTFVARFMGRRISYTYRAEDFVPGERLEMSTIDGPFPMETTYSWSAIDERVTRMTLRNRGGATGLMGLLGPLESIAVRRATGKDLRRLRAILESAS
ncbi:MAG TPA: SRPBCC family protein [Solirubrobacteraceae bacterium]|nr:SRPBCC family protein [Solirubrobacteraceae bacterium]